MSDGESVAGLRVAGLDVRYQGLRAVRELTLSVPPASVVAVLGANGAGKSSLLRAIAGVVRPAAGTVIFEGRDLTGRPAHTLPRRGIALVPEGRELFADLTVSANVRLGGFSRKGRVDEREVIDRFPALRAKLGERAGSLSGGQQQMLAVARGLMSRPRLLLLDEPSLGLAPRIVTEVMRVVAGLREEGRSVLLAEQNTAAALAVADHVHVMRNGRIVVSGTPAELADETALLHGYLGVADRENQ